MKTEPIDVAIATDVARRCTVSWKDKRTKEKRTCGYPLNDRLECPFHQRGGDPVHKEREAQKRAVIAEAIEHLATHPEFDEVAAVATHCAHAGIHVTADEVEAALAAARAA